jgi:hypothetical protein
VSDNSEAQIKNPMANPNGNKDMDSLSPIGTFPNGNSISFNRVAV